MGYTVVDSGLEGMRMGKPRCEWGFDLCNRPGYWGVLLRLINPRRWLYLCSKHEEAQARDRVIRDWQGGVVGWKE